MRRILSRWHSTFFLPSPAEICLPPLTYQKSLFMSTPGLEFPCGFWFYRLTQHLLLHLVFLSTKFGQVCCFILSAFLGWQKTKRGYLRLLCLDIPYSHLFTNILLPWRQGNSAKIDDPQDSKQEGKTQFPSALRLSNLYGDSIVLTWTDLRPNIKFYLIRCQHQLLTLLLFLPIIFLSPRNNLSFLIWKTDSDRFSVFQFKILSESFRVLTFEMEKTSEFYLLALP